MLEQAESRAPNVGQWSSPPFSQILIGENGRSRVAAALTVPLGTLKSRTASDRRFDLRFGDVSDGGTQVEIAGRDPRLLCRAPERCCDRRVVPRHKFWAALNVEPWWDREPTEQDTEWCSLNVESVEAAISRSSAKRQRVYVAIARPHSGVAGDEHSNCCSETNDEFTEGKRPLWLSTPTDRVVYAHTKSSSTLDLWMVWVAILGVFDA